MDNKKYINSAKMKDAPKKPSLKFKLGDKCVLRKHLSDDLVSDLENLHAKDRDLQNQIDSLTIHGMAVSNEFGSDPHIGISQKTLTEAINKIWSKLEDITGEVMKGISMVVIPEYYIGEEGCNVHVTASTVATNGIFEKIEFYINGILISEYEDTDYVEFDTEISETSVMMCKAKILGVEYTEQKVITHYSSFFLGAGTSYTSIINPQHAIPVANGMRGAYDITANDGDHIIIVVGESLAAGFIRADMNGVEIQFTESVVTSGGNTYKVFTSENTYSAGTYNIDING